MNRFLAATLAAACIFVIAPAPVDAQAVATWAVGDSHCLQMAKLMRWKTMPKHGPRNGALIMDVSWQLSRVPWGSDVVVCAGTNDSNPDVEEDVTPYVDAAIDVALLRGLRVVWIGPAYIDRVRWKLKAMLLDERLAKILRHPSTIYISMQPSETPGDCLKDYTHLKDRCYRDLARKAASNL